MGGERVVERSEDRVSKKDDKFYQIELTHTLELTEKKIKDRGRGKIALFE